MNDIDQAYPPQPSNAQTCSTYPGLKLTYKILLSANQINLRFQSSGTLQYGIDLSSVKITIFQCDQSLQCQTCDQTGKCISCGPNATLNTGCTCLPGYYWNASQNQCLKCSIKCNTCQFFEDNCTECFGDNLNPQAYRDKLNKCACNPFFIEDLTKNTCSCNPSDNRIIDINNQCVCDTLQSTGFYQLRQEQTCQKCVQYCQECENYPSNCKKCSNNRDYKNSCKCMCGFYEDATSQCIQLPKQSRVELNGKCVCKEHFYEIPLQIECVECPLKCKTCLDSVKCLTCPPGRDISNNCECLPGYFQRSPTNNFCEKCDSNCAECIQTASNCTKCKGDRINVPHCECPLYTFDVSEQVNCQNCDLSCRSCTNKSESACTSCESYRTLTNEGKCICNDSTYQMFEDRECGICQSECSRCSQSKYNCISCAHQNDILFQGYCYCYSHPNQIRYNDASCSSPHFLSFQIYSQVDQITYENIIIVDFYNYLDFKSNQEKLKSLLQFSLDLSKKRRNLLSSSIGDQYDRSINNNNNNNNNNGYQDTQMKQSILQNNAKQRLLTTNGEEITIVFYKFTDSQIIYKVQSKNSFSSLSLTVSMKNTEFVLSTDGKVLHNENINKRWRIELANQYNYNEYPQQTQQQLDVMNNLKNMKFFRIFEYLYVYMLLMPGFQIIYMIQVLPIQLPPNLYNLCWMFSSLTFEVNQPWGRFNQIMPNTIYDNHISNDQEDEAVPENFRRLGFTSDFLSNSLEVMVLIIILIIFTFSAYIIFEKSQNQQSKIYLNKHYLRSAFNILHNFISYYIEATLFIVVISFWLNLIYIQSIALSIVAFMFGLCMIVFQGYFLSYQMCLIELKPNMIANRHVINFLLICYWYQKFFRIFRYLKKFLILTFLVTLNSWPIVQVSFILATFTIFLVLSIIIRPFMYRIDNNVLILNDIVQVCLASLLVSITVSYENKFANAEILDKQQIQLYLLQGWIAISLIIIFVLLNTFYQLYNFKRVLDFMYKEMNSNSEKQNSNDIFNINNSNNNHNNNINNTQTKPLEFKDIKDNIVQQGDKNYLENMFVQKMLDQEEAEKKKYFDNLTLNQKNKDPYHHYTYIKKNPQLNYENQPNKVQQQQQHQISNNNNNNPQNSQQNIQLQMQDFGQTDNKNNNIKLDISNILKKPNGETSNNMQLQLNNIDHSQFQAQMNIVSTQEDLFQNPYLKLQSNRENYHNDIIFNRNEQKDYSQDNYNFVSFENEHSKQDNNYEPIFSENIQNLQINQNADNISSQNPSKLKNAQLYQLFFEYKQQELQQQMQSQQQQKQPQFYQQQQQSHYQQQSQKQQQQSQQQQDLQDNKGDQYGQQDDNNEQQNQFKCEDKMSERQSSDDPLFDELLNESEELFKQQMQIEHEQQEKYQQVQPINQFNKLEVIPEHILEQDSNYYSPDIFQQRVSDYNKQ